MRHTRFVVVGVFACLVLPSAVDAQSPLLRRGARLRISGPDLAMNGLVVSMVEKAADTLFVEHFQPTMSGGRVRPDTVVSALAIASITKLEVSQGRRSNIDRGARTGALIGATAGLLVGITAAGYDHGGWWDPGPEVIPATIVGGAAWGALIGLAIGSLSHRDNWQEVPLGSLRVNIAAGSPDRFGLAASLEF